MSNDSISLAGPGGPDGAPQPPFTFVEEHFDGSQPCVSVRDARGPPLARQMGRRSAGRNARHAAGVGGRLLRRDDLLRAEGRIDGVPAICRRAAQLLDSDGRFTSTRDSSSMKTGVIKHFDEHSWAWNDNPFVGTRELNGLKIVMMWLSNWDAKDVRDVARGSNTAIFEYPQPRAAVARRAI